MNLEEVAIRIKMLRGEYSQNQFAQKLGVSQNYMSQMENAKVKPSIETLFAISDLCDVSIDYILTGREHKNALRAEEKIQLLEKINSLLERNNSLEKLLIQVNKNIKNVETEVA